MLGNMLAFVAAGVILLLLIGFFILNYTQLFQSNLEAKTASEAAALAYAKDMARVVFTNPVDGSQIALVDQPNTALLTGTASLSTKPILGVNTRMGAMRLDAVIASVLGNATVAYAVQSDAGQVGLELLAFKRLFTSGVMTADPPGWVDMNKNPVTPYTDAVNAYKDNLRKKGMATSLSRLEVQFGYAKPNKLSTNIPVPQPTKLDAWLNGAGNSNLSTVQLNGVTYYKAYTVFGINNFAMNSGDLATSGTTVSIPAGGGAVFMAIADAPSIIDTANFIPWTGKLGVVPAAGAVATNAGDYLPPSIVNVKSYETATKIENTGRGAEQQPIIQTATAQVGGPLQPFATGGLCVGFSQGLPQPDAVLNRTAGGMFNNIVTMMNWSQPNTSDLGNFGNIKAPGFGWYHDKDNILGHWYEAMGGPVTANNNGYNITGIPSNLVHLHTFKGRGEHDDPSMALSYLVYDWLKSMGVYPNVQSVFAALTLGTGDVTNTNVRSGMRRHAMADIFNAGYYGSQRYDQTSSNWDWSLPAYAQDSGVTGGSQEVYNEAIHAVSGDDASAAASQVRNAATMAQDANAGVQQYTDPDTGEEHKVEKGATEDMRDPRSIIMHNLSSLEDPKGRTGSMRDRDQMGISFGDTANHSVVAPANAISMKIDKDGKYVTADGNSVIDVDNLQKAESYMGDSTTKTMNAAKQAFGNIAFPTIKTQIADLQAKLDDATTRLTNAGYGGSGTSGTTGRATSTRFSSGMYGGGFGGGVSRPSFLTQLTAMKNAIADMTASNSIPIARSKDAVAGAQTLQIDATTVQTNANDIVRTLGYNPSLTNVINELKDMSAEAAGGTKSDGTTLTKSVKYWAQVKVRAANVARNADYSNKVLVAILKNQKLLSSMGLKAVNHQHFILAGADFWAIDSNKDTDDYYDPLETNPIIQQMEDLTSDMDMGLDTAYNGPAITRKWDCALIGSGTSQFQIYKKVNSAIQKGFPSGGEIGSLMQPAYAQGLVQAGVSRMFIFSMDTTPLPDGSYPMRAVISPITPYAQTGVPEGQFIYQNTLGLHDSADNGGGGVDDFYWLVQARDLNAGTQDVLNLNSGGKKQYQYFAAGGDQGSDATGNFVADQGWCHNSSYIAGSSGQSSAHCKHAAAEFRVSCPIKGACGEKVQKLDLDGLVAEAKEPVCPPPPPCGS